SGNTECSCELARNFHDVLLTLRTKRLFGRLPGHDQVRQKSPARVNEFGTRASLALDGLSRAAEWFRITSQAMFLSIGTPARCCSHTARVHRDDREVQARCARRHGGIALVYLVCLVMHFLGNPPRCSSIVPGWFPSMTRLR